jgi:hypothetical protein
MLSGLGVPNLTPVVPTGGSVHAGGGGSVVVVVLVLVVLVVLVVDVVEVVVVPPPPPDGAHAATRIPIAITVTARAGAPRVLKRFI